MSSKKKQDAVTSQPGSVSTTHPGTTPTATDISEPPTAIDSEEPRPTKPQKDIILVGNPVRAINKLGLKHSVYVADHTSGEMVPADEEADAPAPKMEKCRCGQLWDTNAIKEGLCPRCRAFAAMDAKIGNSGEMRYVKRGPGGSVELTDNPEEASRLRF